ncbi:MAG: hypothetical protein KHX13_04855 [Acidaminococcus intestini]|uniref:Uncharacterized protein n=1 Tax=Acidaminococcus intestini TaxID=187327 RepID=A0A943EGE9_9FIRM|nr:hypothetical protein [Acidaminococcus intestini]
MKNEDERVPYVSPELCRYLRETYALPLVLHGHGKDKDASYFVGYMSGLNAVMERLEAIQVQQEEDSGIYR